MSEQRERRTPQQTKVLLVFYGFLGFVLGLFVVIFSAGKGGDTQRFPMFNVEQAIVEEQKIQEEEQPRIASPLSVRVPVFIYHSVKPYRLGETRMQDAYDITPELFEEQLKYLQDNNYTTISMSELVHALEFGTSSLPKRPVILTFDDGWKNQYTYAFPLLKKYSMTATIYVYTRPLGRGAFLSVEQIKEMAHAGNEIGSHTLTHPNLAKISHDQLVHEIGDSKVILEKEIGVPIEHFATPYGYSSKEIESIVKNAGYLTNRTIYKGNTHENPYHLKGILVSDSLLDFKQSLLLP